MHPELALRTLAARLCDTNPASTWLEPLPGGHNNHVYRVLAQGREPMVLKQYRWSAEDQRDRLDHEWRFLGYAWRRGVRTLPRAIAQDRAARVGIYTALPGRRLRAGELSARHIEAAAAFVVALNARPRDLDALPPASEACFSLADHLSLIERRVKRLFALDADAPYAAPAALFVRDLLAPAWSTVRARIEGDARALGIALGAPPASAALCVSPSDFGFHNVLQDEEGLSFIDFEYAGRDDAAKLVCDFFCQPEVPVPESLRAGFLSRLADGLGLDGKERTRALALLDAYRIKWACIMLNAFLPGAAAHPPASRAGAAACAAQLAKAREAIDALRAA